MAPRRSPIIPKTFTIFPGRPAPSFTDVEDSWTGSDGPGEDSHADVARAHGHSSALHQGGKRHAAALQRMVWPVSLRPHHLVDPPHGGADAGGMEYPTLITAGTGVAYARRLAAPEVVTEHEFGHQYWYGMVATNEFEEAWLDEGINSYTEVKVMDALYGKNTSAMNFPFRADGRTRSAAAPATSRHPDSDPSRDLPGNSWTAIPTAASPMARPPRCWSRWKKSSAKIPCARHSHLFHALPFHASHRRGLSSRPSKKFPVKICAGISIRPSTAPSSGLFHRRCPFRSAEVVGHSGARLQEPARTKFTAPTSRSVARAISSSRSTSTLNSTMARPPSSIGTARIAGCATSTIARPRSTPREIDPQTIRSTWIATPSTTATRKAAIRARFTNFETFGFSPANGSRNCSPG